MRRTTALCLWFLLGAAPAMAEDFSGFYAGVNAGWALARSRGSAVPEAPGSAGEAERLPPSVSRIEERRLPDRATPERRR